MPMRKPRPRSGPSAIPSDRDWLRAECHARKPATVGQRLMLGTLPERLPGGPRPGNGPLGPNPRRHPPRTRREDGGQELQRPPAGPKRGMQGLAKTLRGRRPRIGPQRPLTLSPEAPAGVVPRPWRLLGPQRACAMG